jgi:hypothetical protein
MRITMYCASHWPTADDLDAAAFGLFGHHLLRRVRARCTLARQRGQQRARGCRRPGLKAQRR